ncbi:hypothetical protein BH24ACT13_BH24ACT13_16220 [soil metagenome]
MWAGAGLSRRSWPGLLAAAEYTLAVRTWVRVEERQLTRQSGSEYVRWSRRRPRWLGLPR